MNFLIGNYQDKQKIYELWKEIFEHDDGGYTDFYFTFGFDQSTNYLLKNRGGDIVSSLNVNKCNIMIGENLVRCSFIVGVLTNSEYRRMGCMNKLMNQTLDFLERQDLVTILQAYNPDIYLKYGFEPYYYEKEVLIDICNLELEDYSSVRLDIRNHDFLKLYNLFTKHFSGYRDRDYQYYLRKQNQNQSCSVRTAVVVDKNDSLLGYMYFKVEKEVVVVEEIIYSNAKVYRQLISYLAVHNRLVKVYVSIAEAVEKLLESETSTICRTLIRVNDYSLMSELLGVPVKNINDVRKLLGKPVYFKEFE